MRNRGGSSLLATHSSLAHSAILRSAGLRVCYLRPLDSSDSASPAPTVPHPLPVFTAPDSTSAWLHGSHHATEAWKWTAWVSRVSHWALRESR